MDFYFSNGRRCQSLLLQSELVIIHLFCVEAIDEKVKCMESD